MMSVAPPGREADDDAHRPRRIGLRPRDPRHGRQRGSARGQMQKMFGGEVSYGLPEIDWVASAQAAATK